MIIKKDWNHWQCPSWLKFKKLYGKIIYTCNYITTQINTDIYIHTHTYKSNLVENLSYILYIHAFLSLIMYMFNTAQINYLCSFKPGALIITSELCLYYQVLVLYCIWQYIFYLTFIYDLIIFIYILLMFKHFNFVAPGFECRQRCNTETVLNILL